MTYVLLPSFCKELNVLKGNQEGSVEGHDKFLSLKILKS